MAAITQQDYQTMLSCVGRLYECDCLEQFQGVTLKEISKLVGCDHITFNYVAPTIPKVTVLGLPVVPGPHGAREETFAQYLADQPVLTHYLATGDAGAFKLSDFLSVRDYHALPLYKHLYHELQYEDQFAFMLFPPGSELISVALSRARRNFIERDRQILNLVRPYVARAYRHVEQISRFTHALHESEPRHGDMRVTSILLDDRDRPIQFGSEAQTWINHFFPERPRDASRLPERVTEWLRGWRDADGSAPLTQRTEMWLEERSGDRLRLRVIPNLSGTGRILVLGLQIAPKAAHSAYAKKLTPREIEVLLEVEQGRSNEEIGVILGISALTVRTHLEHIFDKLHVPSRTAAVTQFRRICSQLWNTSCWLFALLNGLLTEIQIELA